jgi:hypothetical protein
MTRVIAAKDRSGRARLMRDFRLVLLAVWAATAILAAAILIWAPQLLLKKTYSLPDVLLVTGLTGAIMLVRSLRTPPSTLMQAAGELKALARIAAYTSVISIALTLAFLIAWGPAASLFGILVSEIIIVALLNRTVKGWEARHG